MRGCRLLVMLLLPALAACGGVDTAQRARLLDAPAMRRLDGSWEVSFVADPHSATLPMRASTAVVAGTIVLATAHHGPTAVRDIRNITHDGAYDLDFQPFGWTTRGDDDPAVAVARLSPAAAPGEPARVDSVFIVLSPGTPRFSVQMWGTLRGDSIQGMWSASSFSSGGGDGRFVMRRGTSAP